MYDDARTYKFQIYKADTACKYSVVQIGAIYKILNEDNVQLNSEGTCNHTATVITENKIINLEAYNICTCPLMMQVNKKYII